MAEEKINLMDEDTVGMICMEMISNVGEGRSKIYEAVDLYANEKYEEASKKIEEADEFIRAACVAQFEKLMGHQFNGGQLPFNLIILHAMDLVMATDSERDMIKHLVDAKLNK